ncbi:DEAD/DEAH box helicase [Dialister pneumosintes]|uniref:ATP-dependent RNA helicase CshA n=1 Tax=Dialister pneumosintes TaxID=39950 RepID=A0A1B3WCQ4_9FIRM|nr:DEAD/DEAH box helicase [Dialister pneumosintes]
MEVSKANETIQCKEKVTTFVDLGVSKEIIKAVSDMGFEEPTPIQKMSIPVALQKQDIIGQAQTGTGKTAAFGIPILENIDISAPGPQAIVLSPTRELAIQSAEEINHLAQYLSTHALPIYGGQDINRQFRALNKKPNIIVATPGRLMDHMERGTIDLSHVQILVLDEADEMVNMGFIDDIRTILKTIPEERQTMLFSATMPATIRDLVNSFLREPQLVKVKSSTVTIDLVEQQYIELPDRQKFDALCRLLDMQAPELAIVFVRTKRRADEVTEALKKRGYSAEGIHGDLSQAKRDSVIRQFKENTIDILVATDVAARGLDISGVTHVYNFDLPQDPEIYVHRVGRTGRAGQTGQAITFIISREMGQFRAIERAIRRKITRRTVPTLSEVIAENQRSAITQLVETAGNSGLEEFRENAEELLNNIDSTTLVAAAIKLLTKQPDVTPVCISTEAPYGRRNGFKGGRGFRNSSRRGDRNFRRHKEEERHGGRRGTKSSSYGKKKQTKDRRPKESAFKPYFKG